jgi:hypothetical protein
MLYTINLAYAGGDHAEDHARRLQAAANGETETAGGKRWRESKTSTPKTLPVA